MGFDLGFEDENYDNRIVSSASGAIWDINSDDKFIREIMAGRIDNLKEGEIVFTKTVADAFEKDASDLVGRKVVLTDRGTFFGSQTKPLDPITLEIVGVIDFKDNAQFIMGLKPGLELLSDKNGYSNGDEYVKTVGYQSVYVKTTDETKVEEVAEKIEDLGFDAQTQQDVLNIFNSLFSIVPMIFSIVGIIAVIVASIGIINTMIMAVYERTKEIGVMKAVGATNRNILQLFMVEAGMIGFIGGIIAVILSFLVMTGIEALVIQVVLPQLDVENVTNLFTTPSWLVIVTVLFSTLVGILAGIYPAYRASRLDPVQSLRYE
jgi:putative ABC transport system permease protein